MAGSFTVTGISATEPAGERSFGPLSIQGSTVVGETLEVSLIMGDNTFNVPTGSVACLIVPPANGSTALKVRTSLNSGDQGLPINPGPVPLVYAFPATPPVSLIVNSSAPQSAALTIAFI